LTKEQETKALVGRLEKFLDEKGLELNVEKTKIMRFRKRGERKKKLDCWMRKKIEEVKKFKYLGYSLKENGGQEAHMRGRRKKATVVIKEVWGIGKSI